jgi:hypothetical protein
MGSSGVGSCARPMRGNLLSFSTRLLTLMARISSIGRLPTMGQKRLYRSHRPTSRLTPNWNSAYVSLVAGRQRRLIGMFRIGARGQPGVCRSGTRSGGFRRPFHTIADDTNLANLGGDACLVAPAPQEPPEAYARLAAFARRAATSQQHELWQAVGAAMAGRLSSAPLWLSTSGLGVDWLHVRLDKRPNYYTYAAIGRGGH